ncbi:alpha/beta hydrolase [Phenylobacterium sp.]|jgi:pimeloyl-ACP methyl ester carboxylesterase|uniref:alpha/beta fold hydrolase n=1 Tax=Phenylobacterium sp. TaxID=1871053 RepID=UPI002E30A69B|nr:alpha/beta hydrolase [Phenylobacterium sp.]HEX3366018.1 alpha/beta hydrolase [Phenylobacterium sp.]
MTRSPTTGKPSLYLLSGLLCDESVWTRQTAALSNEYDIRIPDLRGFDDITDMATSILAEGVDRFSLVGHSMGARVALEIMRLAPERVERLALLDTGVHPRGAGEAERRQVLVDLADREGMSALADQWLPPMVYAEGARTAALMPGLKAMVERMTPAIHARQIKALLNRPAAADGLSAIRCPVLIGVGEKDAWSPPAQHQAMAARIPQACLVIFPGSGHMAPMEAPDAVTAALKAWLGTSSAPVEIASS